MRKPVSTRNSNTAYRLIDYIGKDDKFIKESVYHDILVNSESLIGNLDLLKHITNIKQIDQINCMDYKSALIIEKELVYNCIPVALIDDYKNKDRSYIDTPSFERHHIHLPLSYVMWNPKMKDEINTYCFCHKSNKNMYSANGDVKLDKETLQRVKEIVLSLKMPKTDIQKCYLISNYLQSKVEYVDKDSCDLVNSVLYNNCGTCISIANASTLLLNNPWMNANVRSVYGSGHAWNVINIDGELYYFDNTWSITRNPNRVNNSLKTTKFTDKYLLFGTDTARNISYHNPEDYIAGIMETDDYDNRQKNKATKNLKKYMPTKY